MPKLALRVFAGSVLLLFAAVLVVGCGSGMLPIEKRVAGDHINFDLLGPPECNAGGPYDVPCQGDTTSFVLDGSNSTVAVGIKYSWTSDCPGAEFDDPDRIDPMLTVTTTFECETVCTVTLTTSDGVHPAESCTAEIRIRDTTAPSFIGALLNQTLSCDDAIPSSDGLSVEDDCDPAPTLDFREFRTKGNCPGQATITRIWTAMDACGNENTATQIIEFRDDVGPELSGIPDDITIECDEDLPPIAEPVAGDDCDPDPMITFKEIRTDGDCPGHYTLERVWTATDACGNSTTASQVIDVADTTEPVLTDVPVNTAVECHAVPEMTTVEPIALDNCDDNPAVESEETMADFQCTGRYVLERTWTATDACGNQTSRTQILDVDDTIAPTVLSVTASPSILWSPNHQMVPVTVIAMADDNCDDNPAYRIFDVTSNEPINGRGDGHTEPDWEILDDYTVNLRAERSGYGSSRIYTLHVECTDACGNATIDTVTVTVPHDQRGVSGAGNDPSNSTSNSGTASSGSNSGSNANSHSTSNDSSGGGRGNGSRGRGRGR